MLVNVQERAFWKNQAPLLNLPVNSYAFLCVTLLIFSVKTKGTVHETESYKLGF